MGLMNSLRRAEEEAKALARRSMEKARSGVEDAERTMRRKMRVHPRTIPASTAASPANTAANTDLAQGGIVSVNGRDVDPEDLDKNAA